MPVPRYLNQDGLIAGALAIKKSRNKCAFSNFRRESQSGGQGGMPNTIGFWLRYNPQPLHLVGNFRQNLTGAIFSACRRRRRKILVIFSARCRWRCFGAPTENFGHFLCAQQAPSGNLGHFLCVPQAPKEHFWPFSLRAASTDRKFWPIFSARRKHRQKILAIVSTRRRR